MPASAKRWAPPRPLAEDSGRGRVASAWLAEPGGLQVQAALQLLAGGLADGAVVVEAGEFGVLGGIEVAAQFPVGQAVLFWCLASVDAGAGVPLEGLETRSRCAGGMPGPRSAIRRSA